MYEAPKNHKRAIDFFRKKKMEARKNKKWDFLWVLFKKVRIVLMEKQSIKRKPRERRQLKGSRIFVSKKVKVRFLIFPNSITLQSFSKISTKKERETKMNIHYLRAQLKEFNNG